MNKRWILALLCTCLNGSVFAQKNILGEVERRVSKALSAAQVAAVSRQSNQAAYQRLQSIFQPAQARQFQAASTRLSEQQSRQVFQVQKGLVARTSASAFALEIDGRVWGVTAAHAMNNIRREPYMLVRTGRDKILSAPIAFYYMSHTLGSDVAIFEIPPEFLPYVDVLKPDSQIPAVQTPTQSPCFVERSPLYLPSEDILFAGPYRLLLRDQVHRYSMSGYCGSPVLAQGKVVAVHVGAFTTQDIRLSAWSTLLRNVSDELPPSLHVATPIQSVVDLARTFTQGSAYTSGTALKVMGHWVTRLLPHEYLFSVQLWRGEMLKKTIHTHPFLNFEKLEEFFELEENDIVRLTILSPKNPGTPAAVKVYDVNVSTGEVTPRLISQ